MAKSQSKYLQSSTPSEKVKGYNIANQYTSGKASGWAGEKLAKEQFNLITGQPNSGLITFPNLPIQADGDMALYQMCRKMLGEDTKNYPQEIGDCVSFGSKNACEYLTCVQNILKVSPDQFRSVFPPYMYGTSRAFIGGGSISGDGSLGSWVAAAVKKYGVLASDEPNVPKYKGAVAKSWGNRNGPPKEFVELAKVHLVKSAAQINNWEELTKAITNGYPVIVCSGQGFNMEPSSDGFHKAAGSWAHCMLIIAVKNTHKTPHGLILNSWGDVHGRLKDFDTDEDLPVGVIRARAEVIDRMLKQQDSFAFSQLDWFQEQKLPRDLFKLL